MLCPALQSSSSFFHVALDFIPDVIGPLLVTTIVVDLPTLAITCPPARAIELASSPSLVKPHSAILSFESGPPTARFVAGF